MIACTVFYSWQSDLPNKTNWGFIQTALERAVKRIRSDDSIEVEPVVDRGTLGVPGCPDIGLTILDKIKKAAVFVCDVSSVAHWGDNRHTPNPNVLVELGYALGTLGWKRVILVMNRAYGGPEQLPFDLRQKLALVYESREDDTDRSEARKKLEGMLEGAIREILTDIESLPAAPALPSIDDLAVSGISENRPDVRSRAERFVHGLLAELQGVAPDLARGERDRLDDLLVEGIAASAPHMARYGRVADAVASNQSEEGAFGLWHGLSKVLENYELPIDFSGSSLNVQFDFYKFIGHESVLMLAAALLQQQQWDLLTAILGEEVYVPNARRSRGGAPVPFTYAYSPIDLLEHRGEKREHRRISVHADLLHERHTQGVLSDISPFASIQEADLLLALRAVKVAGQGRSYLEWPPITCLYGRGVTPRFLLEATKKSKARRLGKALGFEGDPDTVTAMIRKAVEAARERIAQLWGFRVDVRIFEQFDPATIGTRA